MESQKIYLTGSGDSSGSNAGLYAMLASALQSRGLDTGAVLSMLGGRNGNGGFLNGGDNLFAILLLFIIFAAFGKNGFGGNGNAGANTAASNTEREMIMDAIQRNGTDISSIASALNCSTAQVQSGINALATQLATMSGQQGVSAQQIINSIQSGNSALASQIASSCCENRLATCQQTNTLQQAINSVATGQERGFSTVAYETKSQTCELRDTINDGISKVLAGQQAAEMRELQRDVAERDRKISEQAVVINNGQQSALFGQMIGQAVAPITSALGTLQKEVTGIESKLPQTFSVPYQPFAAVPNCVAAQLGLSSLGLTGYWG